MSLLKFTKGVNVDEIKISLEKTRRELEEELKERERVEKIRRAKRARAYFYIEVHNEGLSISYGIDLYEIVDGFGGMWSSGGIYKPEEVIEELRKFLKLCKKYGVKMIQIKREEGIEKYFSPEQLKELNELIGDKKGYYYLNEFTYEEVRSIIIEEFGVNADFERGSGFWELFQKTNDLDKLREEVRKSMIWLIEHNKKYMDEEEFKMFLKGFNPKFLESIKDEIDIKK